MALLVIFIGYVNQREKPVFLIDFSTFEPPSDWKLSPAQILDIMKSKGCYTDESISFLARMLEQSGCGPQTAWPPGLIFFLSYIFKNF